MKITSTLIFVRIELMACVLSGRNVGVQRQKSKDCVVFALRTAAASAAAAAAGHTAGTSVRRLQKRSVSVGVVRFKAWGVGLPGIVSCHIFVILFLVILFLVILFLVILFKLQPLLLAIQQARPCDHLHTAA
jgi:hypothetical protein